MNLLSVLLSLFLSEKFINPPNGSWFNPFGMNAVIVLTGIGILLGILMVRFAFSEKETS